MSGSGTLRAVDPAGRMWVVLREAGPPIDWVWLPRWRGDTYGGWWPVFADWRSRGEGR